MSTIYTMRSDVYAAIQSVIHERTGVRPTRQWVKEQTLRALYSQRAPAPRREFRKVPA